MRKFTSRNTFLSARGKLLIKVNSFPIFSGSLSIYLFIINQLFFLVGGIYTVIRTKAATTGEELGDRYCLLGPLNEACMRTEVDIVEPHSEPLKRALSKMREHDINVELFFYYLYSLLDGIWQMAYRRLSIRPSFRHWIVSLAY